MEDLQLYKKLEVNSQVHSYQVFFTKKTKQNLEDELLEGDIIILDKIIYERYPLLFDKINNKFILIEASEKAKSYNEIEPIISQIVEMGFRRNNKLVAIGGGITQDITSFIAFIIYRGVNWIFFPTNLLSQCDSCIGSKLSVNLKKFKNLVGGFYPPRKIYIDTQFLKSLSRKEIISGLGEMLHYFLVSSKKDMEFFKSKIKNAKKDVSVIDQMIHRSLSIKKEMIELDEFDKGPRNIFNYGHTFGHAIESVTNYKIPHGIAVSYGIDIANYISVKLGFLSIKERNDMRDLCQEIYLDFPLPHIKKNNYENALKKDKKNIGNKIGLILIKGAGRAFKHLIEYKKIENFLEEYFIEKIYSKKI
jgi:3-dehydroquinate synthase